MSTNNGLWGLVHGCDQRVAHDLWIHDAMPLEEIATEIAANTHSESRVGALMMSTMRWHTIQGVILSATGKALRDQRLFGLPVKLSAGPIVREPKYEFDQTLMSGVSLARPE